MTFEEAKAEVMALPDEVALSMHILKFANRATASAGFVTWDSTPPRGVSNYAHLITFREAVYTALGFVQGATGRVCHNEWLIVDKVGHVIVRLLDKFDERPLIPCAGGLCFTGMLGRIHVYVTNDLPTTEWMAGDINHEVKPDRCCARGNILNFPSAFAPEPEPAAPARPPRVPAGAPMWRALQGIIEDENGDPVNANDIIPYEPDPEPPAEVVEETPEFQRLNEGRITL